MSDSEFRVNDRVRARIELTEDLRDEGFPWRCLARQGEELIIRAVRGPERYAVSHEEITDRTFIATGDELELVARAPEEEPPCP